MGEGRGGDFGASGLKGLVYGMGRLGLFVVVRCAPDTVSPVDPVPARSNLHTHNRRGSLYNY